MLMKLTRWATEIWENQEEAVAGVWMWRMGEDLKMGLVQIQQKLKLGFDSVICSGGWYPEKMLRDGFESESSCVWNWAEVEKLEGIV